MWINKPDTPKIHILKETDKLALLNDATRDLINGILIEKWILIKNKKWEYHITLNWVTKNEVIFLVIEEAIPDFKIPKEPETEFPKNETIIWNKNNPNIEQVYFSLKDLTYYIRNWWTFSPLKFIET